MLNSEEHKVMLESLSEQLAVEALDGACAAGCMALLMDREVTSDHDWVSLSVRYVADTGDAVERLILVQDARDFNGSPTEFSSYLFRQFKNLCGKAKMDWQYPLKFLSAVDCGHFGPHFVTLVRAEAILVQNVGSISVPLDRRVAIACYETPAVSEPVKDYLPTFFSTIDVLRQHFAMSGQRFGLLRRVCNYVGERDPWLTYTSSIKFLLENRAKFPRLLQQSVGLDPSQKLIMASVQEKLDEQLFITCLVTFDGVFSQLQGAPEPDVDSSSGWKSILRRLEGHEHVLSGPAFQECLVERIKAIGPYYYLPQEGKARSLIGFVTKVASKVVSQMLTAFRECSLLLNCLESEEDRSRGVLDFGRYKFHEELLSLRKLFPQCSMDSPQVVLRKLPRFEFVRTRPALHRALQRVVTMPLIPPVGPRSAAQLRDGVRRTAAILPAMGTAVVSVAVFACRPSENALARALLEVRAKCPQLAVSRPGLVETRL
ncbi:uncharacterized protein LOC117648630 [Thrips palmi]|uniref:Uncharacterized protein LOC117648630 n=1 Tax=Thrips palmi TaxID=161013 RepID=A0A6P8Z3T9_THRPL|nr:uncharacterized protein LOC117648630 [Thrips palmi]XP_034247143.1 uncharacterized protein LOC117648630 [Thrips palmi]XP_034247144.1 uncharacterized protein LOC117648630 [Thrips palmi]